MYSKLKIFSFSILLTVFALLQTSLLEAGGWGSTEEVVEYEGTQWSGIYFDMNGLYFTASIPNYSGTTLQNGDVTMAGYTKPDNSYMINTSYNPNFMPPKSEKAFVKLVQDANPDYIVTLVAGKSLGAKYAVDLTPKNQKDNIFWRFLSTNNRLIQMATDDPNQNRWLYFFESIQIH